MDSAGQKISAFYASTVVNQDIAEYLRGRGWEVTPYYRFSVLRTVLANLPKNALPDVVLLGGAMEAMFGARDVLKLLQRRRLDYRNLLVVPFSNDPAINELYMRELPWQELLEDGIRMSRILGDSPHESVLEESMFQALEGEIRSARSGIEGSGAADRSRR